MPYVRIKMLLDENDRIFTELKDRLKTRTECVRDMFIHVLSNQERNDKPTVPSEDAIRLQTRIDAEEFVEKIEALYDDHSATDALIYLLRQIAKFSPIRKDLHDRLPEFADALADNAVTNEGFAVLFGIDLESVFQEVHKSNMAKKGGPIDEHGKRHKPAGWTPPDVAGVLRNQGWQSTSEDASSGPLGCELHGMILGGGNECTRCENAQVSTDEPVKEEPQVLMLGSCAVTRRSDSVYSLSFTTDGTTVKTIERCRFYRDERTTVVPRIFGMVAGPALTGLVDFPPSTIEAISIREESPSDRVHAVTIDFRKVG